MNIYGFQKSTLLDYPKHLAATIFLGGCNFRCPFCHNGGLVLHPDSLIPIPEEEVLAYLKKRTGILEGVCVTGGEPTLNLELMDFLKKVKLMGYKIKLDTNGYQQNILKNLVEQKLIDYVAMDIKNSPDHYANTCGIASLDFDQIQASVEFLKSGVIEFEFRTTIVRELHNLEDMVSIGKWLTGASPYYLQSYQDSPELIASGFHAHDITTLNLFQETLLPYLPHTSLRGVD